MVWVLMRDLAHPGCGGEEVELQAVPAVDDEVQFRSGEVYRVTKRVWCVGRRAILGERLAAVVEVIKVGEAERVRAGQECVQEGRSMRWSQEMPADVREECERFNAVMAAEGRSLRLFDVYLVSRTVGDTADLPREQWRVRLHFEAACPWGPLREPVPWRTASVLADLARVRAMLRHIAALAGERGIR